ncbi:MAG TPA: hypothetical protein VMH28_14530 [Candidatus Acidoferrales bacterium]|nr:hypothetical protein [Candidatus Acidoferrales bacterium]
MLEYLRRALLPGYNPIGFGPADFLLLALAALLLITGLAWRPLIEPYACRLARRTGVCMALLAVLPVALRLSLLSHHPVPAPDLYDEFGHLLVADTLRHLRLANPPHPLPQFFETFFVLQDPTYSSIYPVGQGLAMAVGWSLFGLPWAGVLMGSAAFCALCYWMLRAWTTPGWALAGGVLAVVEFGPLNQWTNTYSGGLHAAAAGCLVFGALPRLRASGRPRDAALLGAGLGIHVLIRQYESIFLFLSVMLFFLPELRRGVKTRPHVRAVAAAALALLPALAMTLLQNQAVTGSWTTLPEALSQYQYGVPASLTFLRDPAPHRELTPQQAAGYKMQLSFRHGDETLETYLLRLEYRVRFYRFFFLPPLYLAGLAFLTTLRQYRFAWVALTLALFALGTNFFPNFLYHYVAGAACLFLLAAVAGLQRIGRVTIRGHAAGAEAAGILVLLCCAHFLFWYGMHMMDDSELSQNARQFETWGGLNHRNPARRILVAEELAKLPGRLLVFVRYSPQHIFQDEWVYNAADIDGARIVWARDLGAAENERLLRYYQGRVPLLLEPDARPPRLGPYTN